MAKRKILAQEMFQHVARWRESGMTTVKYAKQIGITNTKLKYWIQKLENQETGKDTGFNFIDLGPFNQNSDITSDREDLELRRCPQIILSFLSGLFLSILVVHLP